MRKIFLLLGLTVCVCSSVVAQQQSRKVFHHSLVQPGSRVVYEKWLNEDVAYIITAEEKRAFMLLKSDEQRERFIEAFWRHRDPQPATDENEYRAEYYGRFAYANQNFAFGDAAGWKTDRGRIYITYGKPDEVQKSSSGEVWIYNRLPGLGSNIKFEFVNAEGKGDFRLQQPKL